MFGQKYTVDTSAPEQIAFAKQNAFFDRILRRNSQSISPGDRAQATEMCNDFIRVSTIFITKTEKLALETMGLTNIESARTELQLYANSAGCTTVADLKKNVTPMKRKSIPLDLTVSSEAQKNEDSFDENSQLIVEVLAKKYVAIVATLAKAHRVLKHIGSVNQVKMGSPISPR